MELGKIFFEGGDLYEGEISWDIPDTAKEERSYTLATGGVKSGKWLRGELSASRV